MLTIGAYLRIPAGVAIGAALLHFLTGCATTPPVSDLCAVTQTIRVKCESPDCLSKSGLDSFSPETAREVYEFNATRDRVCPSPRKP